MLHQGNRRTKVIELRGLHGNLVEHSFELEQRLRTVANTAGARLPLQLTGQLGIA